MNAFSRRGACPALAAPMQTGDGLLVRLNPVAGGLSPAQLIGLAEAAARHGSGIMEVTARGSIQIRGLSDLGARLLADEVDALGIDVRTGVPVETGPLAGLDPYEVADPRPLAEAIRNAIDAAGLPSRLGPKVSVVVDGGGRFSMAAVIADVRLVAASGGRGIPGPPGGATRLAHLVSWELSIGGDPAGATVLGAMSDSDAPRSVMEILSRIAALGLGGRARDLENHRLPHATSPMSMQRPVAAECLPGNDTTHSANTTPLGLIPLRDDTTALAVALPFGSMPATTLAAFAAKAETPGAQQILPALGRALIVPGLSRDACDELRETAAALGFVTEASDPRRFIAACPGAPACASGMIATRAIADEIAASEPEFFDGSFTLHISGCAKGCAHPASAALTLVGGENEAGLVVDGTAKSLAGGYLAGDKAARGVGRIAAAARGARVPDEPAAGSLRRLGAAALEQAYRQGF